MHNLEALFTRAVRVAAKAHEAQVDKGGKPYILHVLDVINGVRPVLVDMTVAALHDVVEDSEYTLETLSTFFPENIIEAVDALTKRDGEDYEAYITRVLRNKIAIRVKMADIRNNIDPLRLPVEMSEKDRNNITKYRKTYARLEAARCD